MANVALKKIPIEAEKWNHVDEATNGNTTKYDSRNGFAYAVLPATYTLVWEEAVPIRQIRLLLWDRAPSGKISDRRYKFKVYAIHGDKKEELFSNVDDEGGNGWYIFSLKKALYVDSIQIEGLENTANESFHIVELEVHDTVPPSQALTNSKYYDVLSDQHFAEMAREAVLEQIAKENTTLKSLLESGPNAERLIAKITKAAKAAETSEKALTFNQAAKKSLRGSIWWLCLGFTSAGIIFSFIWDSLNSVRIFDHVKVAKKNEFPEDLIPYLVIAYFVGKALLISFAIYVSSWFFSAFKAARHNYVVNRQKAMAMDTATNVLTLKEYKNTTTNEVFKMAMEVVFSHQDSGYSKSSKDETLITSSVLEKISPKAE